MVRLIGGALRKLGGNLTLVVEVLLLIVLLLLVLVPNWPVTMVALYTIPNAVLTTEDGLRLCTPAVVPVPAEGLAVRLTAAHRATVDTLLHPSPAHLTIELPYLFEVDVISQPSGAAVYLDGARIGSTPCSLELSKPGAHELLLALPSGISLLDSVTLLTNRPRSLSYALPTITENQEFVRVPGGSYQVSAEQLPKTSIAPLGRVEVRPFYMARHEVTNEQMRSCLAAVDPLARRDTTCRQGYTILMERLFPVDWHVGIRADSSLGYVVVKGMEDHPVTGVTREAAELYCEWLSENPPRDMPEVRFHLPTSAQWEVSARAGRTSIYPWGDHPPTGEDLNLSDRRETLLMRCPGLDDGFATTAPTGRFPPNPWMIYDMAGNVWELVVGPDESRVMAAGGGWISDSSMCRCGSRLELEDGLGYPFVGFRIAGSCRQR